MANDDHFSSKAGDIVYDKPELYTYLFYFCAGTPQGHKNI